MLRVTLSQMSALPSAEKGLAILANLSLTAPVAGSLCGSAWPVARQFPNLGARTGRARQNCCAQAKGQATTKAFAVAPAAARVDARQCEGMKSHKMYFYALKTIDETRIFCDNTCVSAQ